MAATRTTPQQFTMMILGNQTSAHVSTKILPATRPRSCVCSCYFLLLVRVTSYFPSRSLPFLLKLGWMFYAYKPHITRQLALALLSLLHTSIHSSNASEISGYHGGYFSLADTGLPRLSTAPQLMGFSFAIILSFLGTRYKKHHTSVCLPNTVSLLLVI